MLPLGIRKASASSWRVPRKIASAGRTPTMNARVRAASDVRRAGVERVAARLAYRALPSSLAHPCCLRIEYQPECKGVTQE